MQINLTNANRIIYEAYANRIEPQAEQQAVVSEGRLAVSLDGGQVPKTIRLMFMVVIASLWRCGLA